MHIFKSICWFLALVIATGCSNIRVAIYDQQKRQAYARDTREALENSPAGKEIALKKSIMDTAQGCIGTRYKYGGTDPKQGFDCSGLVYYSAKKHNVDLPRSSNLLASAAPHIPWKRANSGDLVFFGDKGRINHVGIIERVKSNELWVIHSTSGRGVLHEDVLANSYWKKRLLFAVEISHLLSPPSTRP